MVPRSNFSLVRGTGHAIAKLLSSFTVFTPAGPQGRSTASRLLRKYLTGRFQPWIRDCGLNSTTWQALPDQWYAGGIVCLRRAGTQTGCYRKVDTYSYTHRRSDFRLVHPDGPRMFLLRCRLLATGMHYGKILPRCAALDMAHQIPSGNFKRLNLEGRGVPKVSVSAGG